MDTAKALEWIWILPLDQTFLTFSLEKVWGVLERRPRRQRALGILIICKLIKDLDVVTTCPRWVVPNLFGTTDQFRGRQFFHQLGVGLGWFQDDSSTLRLSCTLFLTWRHCWSDRRSQSTAWRSGTPGQKHYIQIPGTDSVHRIDCERPGCIHQDAQQRAVNRNWVCLKLFLKQTKILVISAFHFLKPSIQQPVNTS